MHGWLQAAEIVQWVPLLFLQHNVLITHIGNLLGNIRLLPNDINDEQCGNEDADYHGRKDK